MSHRMILRTTGAVMLIEAAVMVIMTLVSLLYGETPMPFLITIAILIVLGFPLYRIKIKQKSFFAKEGYVTAATTWLVLSLFGALPFYINGGFGNYVNCFFEAVSGFTTTGATILSDIESLPKEVLEKLRQMDVEEGRDTEIIDKALKNKRDKQHQYKI